MCCSSLLRKWLRKQGCHHPHFRPKHICHKVSSKTPWLGIRYQLTLLTGRREQTTEEHKSETLCSWEQLKGKPFLTSVTIYPLGWKSEKEKLGAWAWRFSSERLSHGTTAQSRTPAACPSFPSQFLWDAVSEHQVWRCYLCLLLFILLLGSKTWGYILVNSSWLPS